MPSNQKSSSRPDQPALPDYPPTEVLAAVKRTAAAHQVGRQPDVVDLVALLAWSLAQERKYPTRRRP